MTKHKSLKKKGNVLLSLQKGDVVDLIAPASGFSEEEYKSCIRFVESLGLKPRVVPYKKLVNPKEAFCSNTADFRLENLADALSSDSKAIWCIAGGYGSYQLLEGLEKIPMPKKQKLFIGFSDITVLLNYFVENWGWACIYGTTLLQIARKKVSKKAISSIKKLIFNDESSLVIKKIEVLNKTYKKSAEGILVGGCMSLLQSLIGTPQDINLTGKILLLEDDRFETPGRMSRIFNHMVRAGVFDKVEAVVLGSTLEQSQVVDKDEAQKLAKALEYLKKELDKRKKILIKVVDIGHSVDMISVPLGTKAKIKLGNSPEFIIEIN